MRRIALFIALALLFALAVVLAVMLARPARSGGVGAIPPEEARPVSRGSRKLALFVSVAPQAFLLRRIVGEGADVHLLIESGQEPHNFEPSARQMTALASADAYFALGMPYETEADLAKRLRDAGGSVQVIDAIHGIRRRRMAERDSDAREAADGRGGEDPHVWLSPALAGAVAGNMCEALCRLDASSGEIYRANLAALVSDLGSLHAEIAATLAEVPRREFMVFHPAFGYFADAFELRQIAIEVEGKRPSQRQLSEIIERGRRMKIKVLFVQPEFDTASARAVAEAIGAGEPVVIDPLAGDYPANLRRIAAALKEGLSR